MVNPRLIALEIVNDVFENGKFYNSTFDEKVNDDIDARDKAFIAMLSYGTIERCIELDHILSFYSSKPLKKLKPYIRNILRISLYQIKYMDQVPDSAVVNEGVKLAVKKGYGGLRGFVNGILRNITRTIDEVKYPDKEKETVKYLSVVYSMPEWLVEHYLKELNDVDKAENMLAHFINNRDITIRCTKGTDIDDLKNELEKSGISYSDDTIFPWSLYLTKPGRISALPGYSDGRFVVQNESSMIPAYLLKEIMGADSEDNPFLFLDMCAAPGGKSIQTAENYPNSKLISGDVSDQKTGLIKDNTKRLGINNIETIVWDGAEYVDSYKGTFDGVIADVPCSGLGVISGKCDIKYNASKEGMNSLADIQKAILANAYKYVKEGGCIIYSTCTLNERENEQQIKEFLAEHSDISMINLSDQSEMELPERLKLTVTKDGFIKVIPGVVNADGFFVCVMKKGV